MSLFFTTEDNFVGFFLDQVQSLRLHMLAVRLEYARVLVASEHFLVSVIRRTGKRVLEMAVFSMRSLGII